MIFNISSAGYALNEYLETIKGIENITIINTKRFNASIDVPDINTLIKLADECDDLIISSPSKSVSDLPDITIYDDYIE